MKLIVAGEGGSGRSTLAVLLALQFQRQGRRVLLVDADPGREGMHRLAGAPTSETLLGYVARETAAAGEAACPLFFERPFAPGDLPEGCGVEAQGVRMLKIGAVQFPAEGCACRAGGVLGRFLAHLTPGEADRVVVDLPAAGPGPLELPPGILAAPDWVLGVIAPTYGSFRLARDLLTRESAFAPARMGLVINKTEAPSGSPWGEILDPRRVLAELPLRDELAHAERAGAPLPPGGRDIEALCRRLEAS